VGGGDQKRGKKSICKSCSRGGKRLPRCGKGWLAGKKTAVMGKKDSGKKGKNTVRRVLSDSRNKEPERRGENYVCCVKNK